MLRIDNLSKSYHTLLFKNLSLTVGDREKIGLVGLNGCGKSTLFKIIAGLEESDAGSVFADRMIGYLPQEFKLDQELLAGEYLESIAFELEIPQYQVDKLVNQIGLMDEIDPYQYLHELSDGQRMKLYLVRLILDNGSYSDNKKPILLLDEPTNHLDINGIIWLESFLKGYDGIVMIISHDRDFLNGTVDKIIEIDESRLYEYLGNYDDYILGKEHQLELREKQYVAQERRRKKLEDLLLHVSKIGDGKARSRAMSSARKRMEREVTRVEIDRYKEKSVKGLGLAGEAHQKKKMLEVKDLNFSYEKGKEIISDAELLIKGKERVWLYGANGSGKTTFIKLLQGLLIPDSGTVKWGENVRYAYFSQDQSHLDMEMSVAEYFMDRTKVSFDRSFGVLDKYLFERSQRDTKIGSLSPGQRARLSFAVFAQGEFEFLILDEPTNHLDIRTKELIEKALQDFHGNILLISHDRYFVKQLEPDRAISIEDGRLIEG